MELDRRKEKKSKIEGHSMIKDQTIYSYRLLYRFKWGGIGYLVQIILLIGLIAFLFHQFNLSLVDLIASVVILVVPFFHLVLYRVHGWIVQARIRMSWSSFLSSWWGASSITPVSLSFFRQAEMVTCLGSLLISLGLSAWLPLSYAVCLSAATFVSLLPRLVSVAISFRYPHKAHVKYEKTSIAFLLTDG
ncbi:hypothetical protein [Brevibacillus daliensis]|uniref:hypothetical protein n=1 Tax=Brevibacillus daliensis TaxID=2892995 RepID=UPI001E5AFC16|nr:hypothetical protein [Brevibacillus daliensis]